ncbi:MAG: putative Ig domain-containing protein [Nitrospira sp.]|nr:putative Ig domain-containing protein [Nitrospira sp.]
MGACSDVSNAPAPVAGPGPLAILTASPLPDGTVNQAYNLTLTPSGGTSPYTWSLAANSPQLPAGLSLNASTGAITGTPPNAVTSNTEFKLVDSKGETVQKVLPITINQAPVPLGIVTNSLPSGSINQPYAVALGPNGGTSPYTWALKAGSPPLPSGLSLNSGGVISGTPTVTSNATHTFTLTDATALTVEKALQLTISAIPLSITTSSLPQGTANQSYSAQLVFAGGTGSKTWGLAGGSPALPNGLTLNPSSGLISGIPSGTSNQNYTFTVTDQTPPTPQTASAVLQLVVGAAPPTLIITTPGTSSLPSGSVGSAYNTSLIATGGTGAQTWSITSGTLPNGLTLTPSTGAITGTPQLGSNGISSITVRVQDSGSPQQSAQKTLSITIGLPAAPNITTTSLPAGTFNVAYSQTPSITGGFGTLVWGITSGGLPSGLSLNTSNGNIFGTPTSTGTSNFTLRVQDQTSQFDDQTLSIAINPPAPPSINSFTLPTGTVIQAYPATQLTATGGAAPLTWTVTPALPGGLTIAPSTGIISGTPTSGSNGVTTHTFRATDSTQPINQFGELTRTLTINADVTAVTISTPSLPSGTVGQSYSGQLAASGGTTPYTFSVNTGSSLPAGLAVSASGAITGIPTATNSSATTFKVLDSTSPNQQSTTKALAITIAAAPPPLTISTTTLPTGTVGQAYSGQLVGFGGTPAYQWSVTPALPANLQLDQSTGAITGTPGANSSTSYTFTLQDSAAQSVQKSLTLTINAAPLPLTITTGSPLPDGKVGVAYGPVTLDASGGAPAYTWSSVVTPALPTGLTFDAPTHTISGTPLAAEPATAHTFTVQDSTLLSAGKALSLTINP